MLLEGTFAACDVWDLDTEIAAVEQLRTVTNDRQFALYLLTGQFLETSPRSKVLNVGAGDLTITFDPGHPDEVRNGMRMLLDMQKRGYLIAVQLPDGTYTRATEIDPTSGSYILTLPVEAEAPDGSTVVNEPPKRRRGRPSKRVRIPVNRATAVGVARSAGG